MACIQHSGFWSPNSGTTNTYKNHETECRDWIWIEIYMRASYGLTIIKRGEANIEMREKTLKYPTTIWRKWVSKNLRLTNTTIPKNANTAMSNADILSCKNIRRTWRWSSSNKQKKRAITFAEMPNSRKSWEQLLPSWIYQHKWWRWLRRLTGKQPRLNLQLQPI